MDRLLIEVSNPHALKLIRELENLHFLKILREKEQTGSYEWWEDKQFVQELDSRFDAMERGDDKGVTLEELKMSIETQRIAMYGK